MVASTIAAQEKSSVYGEKAIYIRENIFDLQSIVLSL